MKKKLKGGTRYKHMVEMVERNYQRNFYNHVMKKAEENYYNSDVLQILEISTKLIEFEHVSTEEVDKFIKTVLEI